MRRETRWEVPLVLAGAAVLAQIPAAAGRHWLRYDRAQIGEGELWRLLSGHFVHLNLGHLALNMAGLLLVWLLVGRRFPALAWGAIVGISIAIIDLGLWFAEPGLNWYVGMSGLLHGLLVAGLVAGLRRAPVESIALGLLVIAKIVYEQFAGPLPGSEMSSGGPVIVSAHLFGALGGALAGAVCISVLRARSLRMRSI